MLLRQLGPVEQVLERGRKAGNAARLVAYGRIAGPLELELLQQAVARLYRRHPLLSARLVKKGQRCWFATRDGDASGGLAGAEDGDPHAEIRVLTLESLGDWIVKFEAELNRPLPAEQRLAQFTLLRTPDPALHYLFVTTHHAMSDGGSCAHLMAELIQYCCEEQRHCAMPEPTDVLPPLEELMPSAFGGWRGKAKTGLLLLRLIYNRSRQTFDPLPIDVVIPVAERRARLIQRILSSRQTQVLQEAARDKDVSWNAVLTAAMLMAVARQSPAYGSRPVTLSSQTAVSIRRNLIRPMSDAQRNAERDVQRDAKISPEPFPQARLACFASLLYHAFVVDTETDPWELARQVKQKIRGSLRRSEMLLYALCIPLLSALFSLASPKERSDRAVSVTNLGAIKIPTTHGDFELEDYGRGFSYTAYPGTFTAIASQFRDRITLNFVFAEPSLSQARMADLVESTLEILERAANSSPETETPTALTPG